MKHRFFIFLVVSQIAAAQTEDNGRGTAAVGEADAFVAAAEGPWAVAYNPAALSLAHAWSATFFTVPGQFGLDELKTTAVALSLPFGRIGSGIAIERFGFSLYRELTCRCGTGLSVGNGTFLGVTLGITRTVVDRYGSWTAYTLTLGFLSIPIEDLRLGFALRNLQELIRTTPDHDIPTTFLVGALYAIREEFRVTTELEKDPRYPGEFKVGIESSIATSVTLRAGVATNPPKFAAGLGCRVGALEVGFATYSHPDLGWTHQFDFRLNADD